MTAMPHTPLTREEMLETANELLREQTKEQHEEIVRLRGMLAALPNRLASLIEHQDDIRAEIEVPFAKCPSCQNTTPVRALVAACLGKLSTECCRCGVTFLTKLNTVTFRQSVPIADFIFDRFGGSPSPQEQAAILLPYLTGEKRITAEEEERG